LRGASFFRFSRLFLAFIPENVEKTSETPVFLAMFHFAGIPRSRLCQASCCDKLLGFRNSGELAIARLQAGV